MMLPRVKLVDVMVSRWYHCVSRCVRRARLLGDGEQVGEPTALGERRLQNLTRSLMFPSRGIRSARRIIHKALVHCHLLSNHRGGICWRKGASRPVFHWFTTLTPDDIGRLAPFRLN